MPVCKEDAPGGVLWLSVVEMDCWMDGWADGWADAVAESLGHFRAFFPVVVSVILCPVERGTETSPHHSTPLHSIHTHISR